MGEKIGDIIGGVVSNGANQVGALSFTIDDPAKVQAEARADAMKKARVQAEEIANAGGFKLGRLLGIQGDSGYRYDYGYGIGGASVKATMSPTEAAPLPTIEPGSQDINVSVTMQYEIE